MRKRISHFYECESQKRKKSKSEERMEEKMVEEVNYDLLPFWISHEAIADDEHKRDVGEGEERGISGNNHGQCLFRSFNILCSCSSVRFFNALLDLFCPPLILDINKRLEKARWMLYRNLNTNVFRSILYIKHTFWSLL